VETQIQESCTVSTAQTANATHMSTIETVKCTNGTEYTVTVEEPTSESTSTEEPIEASTSLEEQGVGCTTSKMTSTNEKHTIVTETTNCTNGTEYTITIEELIVEPTSESIATEGPTEVSTSLEEQGVGCTTYKMTSSNETHTFVTETTNCTNGTEVATITYDDNETSEVECTVTKSQFANGTHLISNETLICSNGTAFISLGYCREDNLLW
jgi:hypothetical protein